MRGLETAESQAGPEEIGAVAERLAALADRLVGLVSRQEVDVPLAEGAERRVHQLRDHLAGHILPRVRSLDAPLLVLVFGPTGAGKSSLLNALAGFAASPSGVMRPTTRELVVVAASSAREALLAEGSPLESLGGDRVRLVESTDLPEGIALVDSPDVDSIEHANRELTDRLIEAADLGLFVTTATRYADRVPWEVLARARDRGLPLVVIVNRMPEDAADQRVVLDDATRLLAEAGVRTDDLPLLPIAEGALDETRDALSAGAVAPVRERIEALGADREARRALATRALSGSLAGLTPLVERVADDVEHAAIEADALRREAGHAFQTELAALHGELSSGTFLRAEALRQWQAFVGADQITRLFSKGIGRVRGTIAALFRGTPTAPVAEVREDTVADIIALARTRAGEAARRTATAWQDQPSTREHVAADPGLWSVSPGFDDALRARLDAWLGGIADDVQQTGGSKKFLARGASVGVNAAGIAVMLATFAHTGGITGTEVGVATATAFVNQKLLEALFGEAALVEMIRRARTRLSEAVEASFDEERARYDDLVAEGPSLRALAADLRAAAADVPLIVGAAPASEPA